MNLYQPGDSSNEEETNTGAAVFTYEEYLDYKKTCEEQIALGDMAQKLAQIPEFKSLIMEDYFVKEPTRLAALMTSGRLTGKAFDGAVEDLKAIGHLRKFLTDYIGKATHARNELAGITEAYEAAVAQGLMDPENLN